nr:MAG TPA: Cell wall hydrolase autolysin [Caudoviricetes sp.]
MKTRMISMSKIAIVVGHGKSKTGGYDSGAVANGFHEFKLAKECAKYAKEYLNANYECQADLFNYAGDTYLTDRVAKFKDNTYALLAEIHLNAGGGTGTEVYYSQASKGALGQKAAEKISAQIASDFSIRNRGAKTRLRSDGKDYFAIIRDTKPHAVLVETLFISSNDVYLVDTATEQQKMGKSIAVGIANAMGLKAKVVTPSKPVENKPSEVETLNNTIKALNAKITTLEADYKVLQESKAKLISENELIKIRNEELADKCDEQQEKIISLNTQIEEYKKHTCTISEDKITVGQALSVLVKAIKQAFTKA